MRAIFISYRRSDSEGQAGRLFDDLKLHFGADAVFMDVAGLEAGRDFRKAIDEHVATCGVLLAVIGKNWLTITNEQGVRRLEDPGDFVHLETASALKRDIPVVPVLVQGASMPTADQLPGNLKDLTYRNSVELTHARWNSDVAVLIKALEPIVSRTPKASPGRSVAPARASSRNLAIAGVAMLLVALAGFAWYRGSQADHLDASATPPAGEQSTTPAPQASMPRVQGSSQPSSKPEIKPSLSTQESGPPSSSHDIEPAPGTQDIKPRSRIRGIKPAPSTQDDKPALRAQDDKPALRTQDDKPALRARPVLTFRDWEGVWNLRWKFADSWSTRKMTITAWPTGIDGEYGLGILEGRFEGGDVSTAVGQITNTTGTGTTCASGKQTGTFQLTLAKDGQSMQGWWNVCGEGMLWPWEARRQ